MQMKPLRPKPFMEDLKRNARPSTLDFLPGKYPFWTRHASASGLAYIDYDPSNTYVQDGVDIDINEFRYNFTKTPKMLAWFRRSDDNLEYDDSTPIYKMPTYAPDAVYQGFIDASRKLLRFSRRALVGVGSPTTERIYIKFFLFDDEVFNTIENTVDYTL